MHYIDNTQCAVILTLHRGASASAIAHSRSNLEEFTCFFCMHARLCKQHRAKRDALHALRSLLIHHTSHACRKQRFICNHSTLNLQSLHLTARRISDLFASCIAYSHANVEFSHTSRHCMHGFASTSSEARCATRFAIFAHTSSLLSRRTQLH